MALLHSLWGRERRSPNRGCNQIRTMAPRDHETLTPMERARWIKRRATELGFHSCGVTDLTPVPHQERLNQWLDAGLAGTMTYMNRQAAMRRQPELILRGATRAVVVTRNYDNPDSEPIATHGKVARYARGGDYHQTLRAPLTELANTIAELGDEQTIARAFVDAGPVPERELAQRAGLGWIGKNTMLIDPGAGSFLFIAEVLTNLDVAVDLPFEADRCGSCTRCLEACPTGAFPEERVLDARRCISYLTIEHRGPFNEDHPPLNGWVFGCDECQTVCPWNIRFSAEADDPVLQLDSSMAQIDLESLVGMNQGDFDEQFGQSPLERPGLSGMRRNARQVMRETLRD